MSEYAYEGLTVAIKENPDTGYADVGPVVEGYFVPIGRINLVDFHQGILDAGKAAADAAESPGPAQPTA